MAESRPLIAEAPSDEDTSGPRSQWLIAGGIAFVYALVTNASPLIIAAQAGRRSFFQAFLQLAGSTGFAFIATGAMLDFVTGLAESFRAGMEYDHE